MGVDVGSWEGGVLGERGGWWIDVWWICWCVGSDACGGGDMRCCVGRGCVGKVWGGEMSEMWWDWGSLGGPSPWLEAWWTNLVLRESLWSHYGIARPQIEPGDMDLLVTRWIAHAQVVWGDGGRAHGWAGLNASNAWAWGCLAMTRATSW